MDEQLQLRIEITNDHAVDDRKTGYNQFPWNFSIHSQKGSIILLKTLAVVGLIKTWGFFRWSNILPLSFRNMIFTKLQFERSDGISILRRFPLTKFLSRHKILNADFGHICFKR